MARTYGSRTVEQSRTDQRVQQEHDGVVVRLNPDQAYYERRYKRQIETRDQNTHFEKDRDHWHSEMIFLADRDAIEQQAQERINACELIAIDKFPLEQILAATDPEENNRLYDQVSMLENIYINQLITFDYEAGKPFDEQRGLSRIKLIKFFLGKTRGCYDNNKVLTINNPNDNILPEDNLRLYEIKNQIRQLFEEAGEIIKDDPVALNKFKEEASGALKVDKTSIPEKAPELYKERADRKEDPEAFTRRVYEPWLGKGLLRPHIKQLDKPLYQALYKKGFPSDFDTLLPTAQGRSAQLLVRTDEERLEARLDSQRRTDNKRGRTPNKLLQ